MSEVCDDCEYANIEKIKDNYRLTCIICKDKYIEASKKEYLDNMFPHTDCPFQ